MTTCMTNLLSSHMQLQGLMNGSTIAKQTELRNLYGTHARVLASQSLFLCQQKRLKIVQCVILSFVGSSFTSMLFCGACVALGAFCALLATTLALKVLRNNITALEVERKVTAEPRVNIPRTHANTHSKQIPIAA